jgi:hypothetical protein
MDEKDKKIIKSTVDVIGTGADALISAFFQVSPYQIGVTTVKHFNEIKEAYFEEKLKLFLADAQQIDREKADEFLKKLDNDATDFFKRLLIILDRLVEKEKATIIGKIFKALVNEQVRLYEFRILATIIDNANIDQLNYIIQRHSIKYLTEHNIQFAPYNGDSPTNKPLVGLGLIDESIKSETQMGSSAVKYEYKLAKLGKILAEYGY